MHHLNFILNIKKIYFIFFIQILFLLVCLNTSARTRQHCSEFDVFPERCKIVQEKAINVDVSANYNLNKLYVKAENEVRHAIVSTLVEIVIKWGNINTRAMDKKKKQELYQELFNINDIKKLIPTTISKKGSNNYVTAKMRWILVNDIKKIKGIIDTLINKYPEIREDKNVQNIPTKKETQLSHSINIDETQSIDIKHYKFNSRWIDMQKTMDIDQPELELTKAINNFIPTRKGGNKLYKTIEAFEQFKREQNSKWETKLFDVQTKLSQLKTQLKPVLFKCLTIRNGKKVTKEQIQSLNEQIKRQESLVKEFKVILQNSEKGLSEILYNHDTYVIVAQGYEFEYNNLPEMNQQVLFQNMHNKSKLRAIEETNTIFIKSVTMIENGSNYLSLVKELKHGNVQQLDSSFQCVLNRFNSDNRLKSKEYWFITPFLVKPALCFICY